MKRLSAIVLSMFITFSITACSSHKPEPKVKEPTKVESVKEAVKTQDIRVITVANPNSMITGATIENAFTANGFRVDMNKDMNHPFALRYGKDKLWYTTYRLAVVHHTEYTARLAKDYPSIGLITPLSISIWSSNDNKDISISSLTLRGMSRVTQIPMDDPNLIAYAAAVEISLKNALPGGKYQALKYNNVADMKKQLATTFDAESVSINSFEIALKAELKPVGFLFPNAIDLGAELKDHGITAYDFYKTYSIYKYDTLHPVTKSHPEIGAFVPNTFFIYKKKDEAETHIGYSSVDNLITAVDIEDNSSIQPLMEAQQLFTNIVSEILE